MQFTSASGPSVAPRWFGRLALGLIERGAVSIHRSPAGHCRVVNPFGHTPSLLITARLAFRDLSAPYTHISGCNLHKSGLRPGSPLLSPTGGYPGWLLGYCSRRHLQSPDPVWLSAYPLRLRHAINGTGSY